MNISDYLRYLNIKRTAIVTLLLNHDCLLNVAWQYYWDMLLPQELMPAICSIAGNVFVIHQDNAPAHRARDTVELLHYDTPPFHQSWHVASQQSWPRPDWLPQLKHDARGVYQVPIPSLYGRFAAAACWDMDWISAQRGGRCDWSVAKKTGSMYPCRRWSLWTRVTLLAWHLSCHTTNGSFQNHQRLEGNNIPSVRRMGSAFHKVVRWHFQVWWTSSQSRL